MATYKIVETRHLYGPRAEKRPAYDAETGRPLQGLTRAEAVQAIEVIEQAQIARYGCPELRHNEYAPPTYTIVAERQ